MIENITASLLIAVQDRALVELVERHLGRPGSGEAGTTEARYRGFQQQLNARRFVVPLVGVQGSGKSTLLNAILFSDPVLPIDADETTCVPIEICWSDSPNIHARVVFTNGTERLIEPSEEGLNAWVHNAHNPGNRHNVDRVIIETCHSLLADGLVLVDLPGTGSLTAANQATTKRYLEEAVAVGFVLRTVPPLTRSESIFVALQWSRLPSALFVQNRWSDETDAEAESGREHNVSVLRGLADRHRIPRASDGPEVHIVNGYQAFKGALKADRQLIAESGLAAFRERLAVTAKEWPAELASSIRSALLADLQAVAASCAQNIEQADMSSVELEEDMRAERERFARYIGRVDERRAAASTRIARFESELDGALGTWKERQAGHLRNRMREKFLAGIVDGPRLDRALKQEQSDAAEELIEKVQELATVLRDDLRRQFADLGPWSCDRTCTERGVDSKERRKWESAAGTVFSSAAAAAGGAIGTMVGGPIGGLLGGLLGGLIGAWVGDKARKTATGWRADTVEPDVFESIDEFLNSQSEHVRADVETMVDRTGADLDRWTDQQKADFERSQASAAAAKNASMDERRTRAASAARDLAQCRTYSDRLSTRPAGSREHVIETVIASFEEWKMDAWAVVARRIQQRLQAPHAYVTVVGETSAGKSTLINGLFPRQLLPVAAAPTTANVVQVSCEAHPEDRYFALHRNGVERALDRAEFEQLSGSLQPDVLRLQARARPTRDACVGLQVFDTPGFDSIVAEHEEVLREFLPNSDSVVYVVGYRTGFGQSDQSLLELVARATADDPTMPLFLVVNRCPGGIDANTRRVKEIASYARDCVGREPELLLIHSASIDSAANSSPAIPDSSGLWDEVARRINGPERNRAVARKLRCMLRDLLDEADAELERRELTASADEVTRCAMNQTLEALAGTRDASLAAVARTIERLRTLVPTMCRKLAERIRTELHADIDASDKWLGSADCLGWINGHALEHGLRAAAGELEGLIELELQRLDDELESLANTAFSKVKEDAPQVTADAAAFRTNVTRALAERIAGSVVHNMLRGLGGVGGAAAGAGNLAKRLVSRGGRLFGRRFSRPIYDRIGRMFTNRALKRINALAGALIDGALFVRHAHAWRGELNKSVGALLDQWAEEVIADFLERQLPVIEHANRDAVAAIYEDLIEQNVDRTPAQEELCVWRKRRKLLRALRETLCELEDES